MRVRQVLKPGVTDEVTAETLTSTREVSQSSQYYDGLGRLVQTVVKQAALSTGSAAVDLVNISVFDNFDRWAY